MSRDSEHPRFDTIVTLLAIVLFVVSLNRTDFQALGYGSVVFMIGLFFVCVLLTFGGAEVVKVLLRARSDPERSIQGVVTRGWFWLYVGAVLAFVRLWPWQ